MTMREKVEQELRDAKYELENAQRSVKAIAEKLTQEIYRDAYGMTPGLGCSHAALQMAQEGAKIKAKQNLIDMLTYFLRNDCSEDDSASKAAPCADRAHQWECEASCGPDAGSEVLTCARCGEVHSITYY